MAKSSRGATKDASDTKEHSAPRRRLEAWLPRLVASINSQRTRELIPQLGELSREEKLERATNVFRRLVDEEPDSAMQAARRWSLEYFEACAEGRQARRQFLIDEGVFGDDKRLVVPERVRTQMEIGNLEPTRYPEPFAQEVADLTRLMFHEYFGVKNLLSLPEGPDLLSWMLPFTRKKLAPPRLKLSLLLKDYVEEIVSKTRRRSDVPLVAIFGPGKGEELVPLIARGLSVLCLDAHDAPFLEELHRATFGQAGIEPPETVVLGSGRDVDPSPLGLWRDQDCTPTIFIVPGIDANHDDLIPEPLHGAAPVAASIYLLHELERKEALIANMARISRGSIIVFDGYPSVSGLDSVILPVSDRYDAVVTGHDAVLTHILCQTPEEMEAVARRAVPEIEWKGMLVGPPLPPPLFHKLQGAVIGRHTS